MPKVTYQPNTGRGSGIDQLLRSEQMRRFMADQGERAAILARSYSGTRGTFRTETVEAFDGRWAVNVINTAPDARRQEYGTRREAPLAPLGQTLVHFWSKDPYFWSTRRR